MQIEREQPANVIIAYCQTDVVDWHHYDSATEMTTTEYNILLASVVIICYTQSVLRRSPKSNR